MTFGYARISKTTQNYDLQEDAMKKHHCGKLFFEKENGLKYREENRQSYFEGSLTRSGFFSMLLLPHKN